MDQDDASSEAIIVDDPIVDEMKQYIKEHVENLYHSFPLPIVCCEDERDISNAGDQYRNFGFVSLEMQEPWLLKATCQTPIETTEELNRMSWLKKNIEDVWEQEDADDDTYLFTDTFVVICAYFVRNTRHDPPHSPWVTSLYDGVISKDEFDKMQTYVTDDFFGRDTASASLHHVSISLRRYVLDCNIGVRTFIGFREIELSTLNNVYKKYASGFEYACGYASLYRDSHLQENFSDTLDQYLATTKRAYMHRFRCEKNGQPQYKNLHSDVGDDDWSITGDCADNFFGFIPEQAQHLFLYLIFKNKLSHCCTMRLLEYLKAITTTVKRDE